MCHGRPGVGRTQSAREFSEFPDLPEYRACSPVSVDLGEEAARCRAIFYTALVTDTPRTLDADLGGSLTEMGYARLTVDAGLPAGLTRDANRVACPLIIVDETDRRSIKLLEHLRDLSDRHCFGLILLGIPGLEQRLAR